MIIIINELHSFSTFISTNSSLKISIETPLICELFKIVKFNKENDFLTCILRDQEKKELLAFFYNKLANILNHHIIRKKLPFTITIIKAKLKESGNEKYYIDIHHAILENDTYINSNFIGSYKYCPMQTYLHIFIKTISEPNENQLWGNIIHDYLSNIFSQKDLDFIKDDKNKLKKVIISALIKSIYSNWRFFVALEKNPNSILEEFTENFLENEIKFIFQEINKYSQEYGAFEFICEKMVYSKNFGIQGRIDRIVQNKPFTKFKIIETKTGKSPQSSQIIAFYQSMAYATILQEYYPSRLDEIIIEFPRLTLNERLISYDFDDRELLKVLQMRNEIWQIMYGVIPDSTPFPSCNRCTSQEICDFYLFKENKVSNHNKYNFNSNKLELFNQLNAYYSWLSSLLDDEFFQNRVLINEIHLDPNIREKMGNCIANLIIQADKYSYHNDKSTAILTLIRNNGVTITNNRLRSGDYILITPQNFIPLTSESKRARIISLSDIEVKVEFFKSIKPSDEFYRNELYRIDQTTSNYMVNLQKGILDLFFRQSFFSLSPTINNLRDILLFKKKLKTSNLINSEIGYKSERNYDISQNLAIQRVLNSKDMILIQGPPGTGKTTIIAEIANQLIQKNQREKTTLIKTHKKKTLDHYLNQKNLDFRKKIPILISSYTNKALDNILVKIVENFPSINIVRLGNVTDIDNLTVLKHSIQIICQQSKLLPNGEKISIIEPNLILEQINNADIIACTTTTAGNMILRNMIFKTVILDEAGQITETSALIALMKGVRSVLVGDHMQLPPITKENYAKYPDEFKNELEKLYFSPEKGLGLSIFERLVNQYRSSKNYIMLSFQYRMNKIISNFVSQQFYQGNLSCGIINQLNIGEQSLSDFYKVNNILSFNYSNSHKFGKFFNPKTPMIFIDTKNIDNLDSTEFENSKDLESKFNSKEAEITADLMGYFIEELLQEKFTQLDLIAILNKIGIISGYRAHNQLIIKEINNEINEIIKKNKLNLNKLEYNNIEIQNSVQIDTVDRFQGQEREIIIYNFVDSNKKKEIHTLNQELRRLNVAISRAKKKIIFIGNSNTLAVKKKDENAKSIKFKEILSNLIKYIADIEGYSVL